MRETSEGACVVYKKIHQMMSKSGPGGASAWGGGTFVFLFSFLEPLKAMKEYYLRDSANGVLTGSWRA